MSMEMEKKEEEEEEENQVENIWGQACRRTYMGG
jgi:hypothetical protein